MPPPRVRSGNHFELPVLSQAMLRAPAATSCPTPAAAFLAEMAAAVSICAVCWAFEPLGMISDKSLPPMDSAMRSRLVKCVPLLANCWSSYGRP